MLELPECVTIARQLDQALRDRTIAKVCGGNSPHKFAFIKPSVQELENALPGRRVSAVTASAKSMIMTLDPKGALSFHEMDARVLLTAPGGTLPSRYQFLLAFDDGTVLTVTISLWGFIGLDDRSEAGMAEGSSSGPAGVPTERGIDPLSREFTVARLRKLLADYEKKSASLKAFLVNRPCIKGFGNGYMQEILFAAGLRPTRAVGDLSTEEQARLHQAIRSTLTSAVKLGGSEDERDVYGTPGRYQKMVGARVHRCKVCGADIEKKSFLGGATYWCPRCQR
ncbi:MAG TPA: DNA-formamidopyrimidine glycosylase family protein [Spirochaetia bacterium]|nr:DNA-formamidopyrimidine glycosylase family protein [Spirochaetia bacterium]